MAQATKQKPIIVVQGAQWGSEGKGMVAAALAKEREADYVVRTGTVNAGHTVYHTDRGGMTTVHKMQQLPTSWATRPEAVMVLGAGAYIHPDILMQELETLRAVLGWTPNVIIDHNAGLHLSTHTERAVQANRHHAIGATGKGCSEAVIDKVRCRGTGQMTLFKQWVTGPGSRYNHLRDHIMFEDVSAILNHAYRDGRQILIEGTQGSHLDLHLGPYPFTTHKQSQAAQWALEAGLGLGLDYEIVLVARTYPIRVAGNSGPMPRETSWVDIAREINGKLRLAGRDDLVKEECLIEWERAVSDAGGRFGMTRVEALRQHQVIGQRRHEIREGLSECHRIAFSTLSGHVQRELRKLFEFTTVTGKLRRVARWDGEVVRKAMEWNGWRAGRDKLVLSFINYLEPTLWGATKDNPLVGYSGNTPNVGEVFDYITTGPETQHFIKIL